MNRAEELDRLVASAEPLLDKLSSDRSPEIAALRDKVDDALFETWHAALKSAEPAPRAVRRAAICLNGIVHDAPWLAVGLAVACAGILGWTCGRNTRSTK